MNSGKLCHCVSLLTESHLDIPVPLDVNGFSESQYGLRHVSCVLVWNGDILTCRDYDTAALWFRAGLKPGEQDRAVARLCANLQGLAKEEVRTCRPQDFEDARGVERVLRILRKRCLCQTRARRFMRAIKSGVGEEK